MENIYNETTTFSIWLSLYCYKDKTKNKLINEESLEEYMEDRLIQYNLRTI
jgi:hypothetical protein